MKTAIQLQEDAREAAISGDLPRLEELHAELMHRFILGFRVEAVRVGEETQDGEYIVRVELENRCALLFPCEGPNPFAIFVARPE